MSQKREQEAGLLGILCQAPGQHMTATKLKKFCAGLKLSINDLEKTLQPYIEAGYPIQFHPQGGLIMQEPPDIWCAEEIVGRLGGGGPYDTFPRDPWDPVLLVKTASTNDVARDHARKGAKTGFLVAASQQTSGRGRLGRSWESPAGRGLYVSLVLRPEMDMAEAGRLTILTSLAVSDAVEAVAGVRPQIKWPNDIVLNGRKLAGVLIETEQKAGRLVFAVVGIGLNVRHEKEDFSPEVRGLATSLFLATGRAYRRVDLLIALLQAFERRLSQPFRKAREAWASSSLTLGQRVTLTTARGRKFGQAVGLDESGALLVRNDSGEVEAITAGDMQAV
jgi:BirA family biotin operon repressor/biotin-[acetyl-CoA-carboxylase] ligase